MAYFLKLLNLFNFAFDFKWGRGAKKGGAVGAEGRQHATLRHCLGPLLFLIHINDISNTSNEGEFILFAVDTNIFLKLQMKF